MDTLSTFIRFFVKFFGNEIAKRFLLKWDLSQRTKVKFGMKVHILTCEGNYVGINLDESSPDSGYLGAWAQKPDAWETFTLIDPENPYAPPPGREIHYGDKIAFQATNGYIVGANLHENGNLKAWVRHVDAWETFVLVRSPLLNTGETTARYGSAFALQATNQKYVMCHIDTTKRLAAVVPHIDRWETFIFIDPEHPF